jgi:hypothetical protein
MDSDDTVANPLVTLRTSGMEIILSKMYVSMQQKGNLHSTIRDFDSLHLQRHQLSRQLVVSGFADMTNHPCVEHGSAKSIG